MQGWLFSYDPFWKPPQMKVIYTFFHFYHSAFLVLYVFPFLSTLPLLISLFGLNNYVEESASQTESIEDKLDFVAFSLSSYGELVEKKRTEKRGKKK